MGIIQSGFNNALTGTAFLLNQAGAFNSARNRTETDIKLNKLEGYKDKLGPKMGQEEMNEAFSDSSRETAVARAEQETTNKYHDALENAIVNTKKNSGIPEYTKELMDTQFENSKNAAGEQWDKAHEKELSIEAENQRQTAINESIRRLAEQTRLKQEQKNRILKMVDELKHQHESNQAADDFLNYMDSRKTNKFDKEADDFLNYVYGGKK